MPDLVFINFVQGCGFAASLLAMVLVQFLPPLGRSVATRWRLIFVFFFFCRLPPGCGHTCAGSPPLWSRPWCVVSFIRFKLQGELSGLFPLFCVCLLIYLSEAAVVAAVLFCFFFFNIFSSVFFLFFLWSAMVVVKAPFGQNVAVAIWRLCYLCNSLRQFTFTCVFPPRTYAAPVALYIHTHFHSES